MKPEPKLCECGCGEPVKKPTRRFIWGHHQRLPQNWPKTKVRPDPALCACGCGERVTSWKRKWKIGHASKKPGMSDLKLCACGCGGYAPQYHRFIQGHFARTQDREELIQRLKHSDGRVWNEQQRLFARKRAFERTNTPKPTPHEALVMAALEERGIEFRFNVTIGGYVRPDFSFPDAMLVIQIDGTQHGQAFFMARDIEQDAQLASDGWYVLRWPNRLVNKQLPALVDAFEGLYRVRLNCQGSGPVARVDEDSTDEPPV